MFWWDISVPICKIKYVKIQYNCLVLHAICLCQHAYGLYMSTYNIILWKRFLVSNNKLYSFSSVNFSLINYSQTALFEIWKYQLFFPPLHLKGFEFRWKILISGLELLTIHMSDRDSLLWYSTESHRNRAFSRFRNSEWWYIIFYVKYSLNA